MIDDEIAEPQAHAQPATVLIFRNISNFIRRSLPWRKRFAGGFLALHRVGKIAR
jgi:hypothetical protein